MRFILPSILFHGIIPSTSGVAPELTIPCPAWRADSLVPAVGHGAEGQAPRSRSRMPLRPMRCSSTIGVLSSWLISTRLQAFVCT